LTAAYASDILDRVTNITYRTAGGGLVRSFAYSYDAAGLITQKVTEAAGGQTVTNANAYDGLGRLVSESFTQSGTNALTHFSYDLAGNRLSVSSEFSVVNNTYTHNRLTAVSDGTSLAYDTAGNVTNIVSAFSAPSARKLTWNAQRQLVSVSTNGAFAESYAYDALGRRISTTDSSGTTYHVYDGDECVADLDASGNPFRSYVWGPGIDDLLAVTVYGADATNTYYAIKDHLGSVHALVDESGNAALTVRYDAWGTPQVLSFIPHPSSFPFRYLFQGREYSFATGLYSFRARWYEPRLGRWLSNAPIGISGGLNLYEFCRSNPVNWKDPNGLEGMWGGVKDAAGKLWNLPNSALGLGLGLIEALGGADVSWGNNGLQFENSWLMFPDSGLTLGNVIFYEDEAKETYGEPCPIGAHERQHTRQGELLGPFYLPDYVGGMISAGLQGANPFGPANFMETGPYTKPTPQVWP